MSLEWLLFAALLFSAAVVLARSRLPRPWGWRLGAALAALAVLCAAGWWATVRHASQEHAAFLQNVPSQGRPDGYRSSDTCRSCHPDQYASWHHSFHRTMTQVPGSESVVGNFNQVKLELLGRSYFLDRQGDEFWVEMDDPQWKPAPGTAQAPPRVRQRVTLLTGSHHMQVYWTASRGNMQTIFPFAWLIADQRWAPFHNTFLRDPAIPPDRQTWNLNCINCHATAGQARPSQQKQIFETRAGELGIACEACHGPGEDHIYANQNAWRRYARHFSDTPDPTIVNPAKLSPHLSAQACGQCHGIKWLHDGEDVRQNGFRFRPGAELAPATPLVRPARLQEQPWLTEPLKRNPRYLRDHYWSDGMVRVSGREYNGVAESPCHLRGALSCVSCHTMHHYADRDDQLIRPRDARGWESNEDCTQCHKDIGAKLTQHTHHAADSSGSLCYNCHMPHTTYGLLKGIRSHHIDSPSARASVETGRPNACNLCHLDRTLDWAAKQLSEKWGQKRVELGQDDRTVSAAVQWALKGDAGQRALLAWHFGWEPAQAISGKDWLAPHVAELLNDPYSAVRFIGHRSLKTLGTDYQALSFDFAGPEPQRAAARAQVLQIWERSSAPPAGSPKPEILLDANGKINRETFQRLLSERNHLSIDLQE